MQENLSPTLLKGLTELARNKPSSNSREVLRSLANWLLDNNPNKVTLTLQCPTIMHDFFFISKSRASQGTSLINCESVRLRINFGTVYQLHMQGGAVFLKPYEPHERQARAADDSYITFKSLHKVLGKSPPFIPRALRGLHTGLVHCFPVSCAQSSMA